MLFYLYHRLTKQSWMRGFLISYLDSLIEKCLESLEIEKPKPFFSILINAFSLASSDTQKAALFIFLESTNFPMISCFSTFFYRHLYYCLWTDSMWINIISFREAKDWYWLIRIICYTLCNISLIFVTPQSFQFVLELSIISFSSQSNKIWIWMPLLLWFIFLPLHHKNKRKKFWNNLAKTAIPLYREKTFNPYRIPTFTHYSF